MYRLKEKVKPMVGIEFPNQQKNQNGSDQDNEQNV
jgi:hypothetical protein